MHGTLFIERAPSVTINSNRECSFGIEEQGLNMIASLQLLLLLIYLYYSMQISLLKEQMKELTRELTAIWIRYINKKTSWSNIYNRILILI